MSKIRRTFKYRLFTSKKQAAFLDSTLAQCQVLYNAALQERRDAWKMGRATISFQGQSAQLPSIKKEIPEYSEVFSQVLQNVLHRVDWAFQSFYRRCKGGQTPGYPRFRSRDRYDSMTYPQAGVGWALEGGTLRLSKIGSIKIRLHRPWQGTLKTLIIKRECGRWYACFTSEVEADPLPPSIAAIGIDLGLESFLTASDGASVANPRHLRRAEADLVNAQQRVSRRNRGSYRRRKAVRVLAMRHLKVRNSRRDFHHKTALELVKTNGFIAAEDLRISNMVQNHSLAKSISDAGWGQFINILQAKAEYAGREVVLVNPRNTSQTCSGCGAHVPKPLSERVHSCVICGLVLHRDVNAARNILALGRSVQGRP